MNRALGLLEPSIAKVTAQCFANATNPPPGWQYGEIGYDSATCANLMECVLDNVNQVTMIRMGSGSAIAGILPTMLALVGAGPMELVQRTITSPVRGIATCLFGIGLPAALFRQLHDTPETNHPIGDCRSWRVPVLRSGTSFDAGFGLLRHIPPGMRVLIRIFCDGAQMALACVMLWRNWKVSRLTMVTWYCGTSWLLFLWPIFCLAWLSIAIGSLALFARSVTIEHAGEQRGWLDLLSLPYRPVITLSNNPTVAVPLADLPVSPKPLEAALRNPESAVKEAERVAADPTVAEEASYYVLRITMRHPSLWRWYEAFIESTAVIIYAYATLVLSSIAFLTGTQAAVFAIDMLVCLCALRLFSFFT